MEDKELLHSVFEEIDTHLVGDSKPSLFLNQIADRKEFAEHPFDMLLKQKTTMQSPKHHPEGNVWNHTMLVVDEAAVRKEKSTDARIFMWAALLHDIGKPPATKIRKNKITAYDHDRIGAKLAKEFLAFFERDEVFISAVAALVRWHMQILYVVNHLPFQETAKMKSQVDMNDIALLGLCDRLGRGNAGEEEEKNIEKFLEIMNSI